MFWPDKPLAPLNLRTSWSCPQLSTTPRNKEMNAFTLQNFKKISGQLEVSYPIAWTEAIQFESNHYTEWTIAIATHPCNVKHESKLYCDLWLTYYYINTKKQFPPQKLCCTIYYQTHYSCGKSKLGFSVLVEPYNQLIGKLNFNLTKSFLKFSSQPHKHFQVFHRAP
jgi:hypothetical protein